jgi:tRNA threonylcarbamoyladenosine biosynthesis protein TsaE
MRALSVVTHSPEETVALGRKLAREFRPPVLVLLLGDLGAGKTTLTKGMVAGLGAAPEEEVTSPTFTMIHEYRSAPSIALPATAPGTGQYAAPRVYHVDLYRVETARELETLGLEDLIAERAVVIVEWGEKLGAALRPSGQGSVIEIHLEAAGESARRIEIQSGREAEEA